MFADINFYNTVTSALRLDAWGIINTSGGVDVAEMNAWANKADASFFASLTGLTGIDLTTYPKLKVVLDAIYQLFPVTAGNQVKDCMIFITKKTDDAEYKIYIGSTFVLDISMKNQIKVLFNCTSLKVVNDNLYQLIWG